MRFLHYCLFCLLLLILTSAVHAEELGEPLISSIDMPAPDGYVEVDAEEHQGYVGSLAFEMVFRSDIFLRLFVKEKEYPLVDALDIDELTGTVTAVWFQGYDLLPEVDWTKDPEGKKEGGLIFQKIKRDRIRAIEGIFAENCGRRIDNSTKALGKQHIDTWLKKNTNTPQDDYDLGFIRSGEGYTIYAWLQAANNDAFSYGMFGIRPVAVTFATVSVGEKTLGLIFADKVRSAEDVVASVDKATQYVENNRTRLSVVQVEPRSEILRSFADPPATIAEYDSITAMNVLSFVAGRWTLQAKYQKAIDAHRMLIAQLPSQRLDRAAVLSNLYVAHGDYKTAVKEIPNFLAEAQNTPGGESIAISLHQALGAAYFFLERWKDSETHLSDALRLALTVYGPLHEETISLQESVASVLLMMERQYSRAQKLMKDSLTGNAELNGPYKAGDKFIILMEISEEIDKYAVSVFYCKIAAAHYLFEGALDDESIDLLLKPLRNILYYLGIASNNKAFKDIINSPNRPDDTPYNRGRDWMRGPEIALYARYGEVAVNLEHMGKTGTEEQKEAARADFRAWLDSVETTLNK